MKPGNWKHTIQVVNQAAQQRHAATADTSQLSSLPFTELAIDLSGPPTVFMDAQAPLSTSTPIHLQITNDQSTDSPQDDYPYQQIIPGISHNSLCPTLSSINTEEVRSDTTSVPLYQCIIQDIDRQQQQI